MTKQMLFAAIAGIMSLLSLLAGSGLGRDYDIYPITACLVAALYVAGPVQYTLIRGHIRLRELLLTLGLLAVVGLWPLIKGYGEIGLEYLWLLLLPYVVGQLSLSREDIKIFGFVCGISGGVILSAYVYLGVFENWNLNTLSMAGFMGCAVCAAVPWESWGEKLFYRILLGCMIVLVLQLDSRSCLLGLTVLLLFSLKILKMDVLLKKDWLRRMLLVLPLLIALAVVLFKNSEIFVRLNAWTMEKFDKPVFNGRDFIWEQGLKDLSRSPLFGSGKLNNGYWHNCAIACLTAFGIVGYGLWVLYFENIMVDAKKWAGDPCLSSCTAAFLTIMLQQSFELGLISTEGSMLPYLIIGIMLGRMRYLRHQNR